MQKIISFNSKDFLSGISEYPNTSNYGFWQNGFMNPYSRIGTIQTAQSASDLTNSTWVIDKVQNFVQNNEDLYGLGENGNFYKVDNVLSGLGTITNLRVGTVITSPAVGLEVFKTHEGNTPKIYYWMGGTSSSGYIGEYDIGETGIYWNDKKFTISSIYNSSTVVHPTYRISDTIYYGSGYVLSKIYDDYNGITGSVDPQQVENILDLPRDYTIVSLETDGTYLIIAAQIKNSNDTKIYFWDYKNRLDSWTLEYTIRDTIYQLKNTKGVIYATGKNGIYAFNSATEPTKLRSDVKSSLYQGMVRYNDGLFVAGTSSIKSLGKILPTINTGVFSPFLTTGVNSMIIPSYVNNNYLYYSVWDGASAYRIKSQSIIGTPTSSLYQSLILSSSVIDLGQDFIIKRIDVTFIEPLVSGQTVNNIQIRSGTSGSTADTITFTDPSFADYGGVRKCELFPQASEIITSEIQLVISDNSGGLGINAIKRIDIYGDPAIK